LVAASLAEYSDEDVTDGNLSPSIAWRRDYMSSIIKIIKSSLIFLYLRAVGRKVL